MTRNGEQKPHVRWHPRDLGGVEVYIGDNWITVLVVKTGFETWNALIGKSGNIWLNAIHNPRAAHPDLKTLYFDMIDEAMRVIEERNAQARFLTDLFVDERTEERVTHVRQRLLISLNNANPSPARSADQRWPGPFGPCTCRQ